MIRFARCSVLVAALLSLFAMGAASAGAVTWDNSGDTHFTTTGGPGTLSATGVSLSCAGSDGTARTTTPVVGVIGAVVDATVIFTACLLAGQNFGMECGITLTASAAISGGVTGNADVTCSMVIAGVKNCHFEGGLHVQYVNPVLPSTSGNLTTTTGGSLRTTNGAANCPLGSGDPVHLSPLTFRVAAGTGGPTPHLGPIITRTA
jgi:hypothetical protein